MLHKGAKEVAKDIWDLGKEYGIVHRGKEGEILQEMEVWLKGAEGNR